MRNRFKYVLLLIATMTLMLQGCEESFIPKPKGYARIDFPAHAYQKFQIESCPFNFDFSELAQVERVKGGPEYDCWFNVVYPGQNAKIHFSYYPISKTEVEKHIKESRKLAMKHLAMADDFEESVVLDTAQNVFGIVYDFKGSTASNLQFYLTDSSTHFIRGALYFEIAPNADSLAPAEEYIEDEIYHLVKSFQWK